MQIVNWVKSNPLDTEDLKIMLGPHKSQTKILRYENLAEIHSPEQLFSSGVAVIVFLSIHDPDGKEKPVGHWITLLNHKDHYEHFDSYGLDIEEELAITHENADYITKLFSNSKKPLISSSRKLQSKVGDVNTCGRWCVARVHLRKFELDEFYKFIEISQTVPDVAVTLMTMFL